MSYLAVDKNGTEMIFYFKPSREFYCDAWDDNKYSTSGIPLPQGTIEKIIGRILTWEDEPYELKESKKEDICDNCIFYIMGNFNLKCNKDYSENYSKNVKFDHSCEHFKKRK